MTPRLPIERWAERAPALRWPLVGLLIILLIGLAGGVTGCGGGGDDEPCRFEWITLADGRPVPAPNNCPAVQQ